MITGKRKPSKSALKNKLDKVFSLVVRQRGRCERCFKAEGLQCSHIHSRTKMSVRWELQNAFCLCSGCHKFFWHQHPIDAAEWARKKMGEVSYDLLIVRAQQIKRWTPFEMEILLHRLEGMLNEPTR